MDREEVLMLEEITNSLSVTYASFRHVVLSPRQFNEIFDGIFTLDEAHLLMEGMEKLLMALAERRREGDKTIGREN